MLHLHALPRPFPMTETTYGNPYTRQDRLEFGHLETEDGRMRYTLSRFTERGLPAACALTLRLLLSRPSVLQHWSSILPELRTQTENSKAKVMQTMQKASPVIKMAKRDFISVPVDFDVDEKFPETAICLWKRALAELSRQVVKGKAIQTETFLEIHAFLRDPIGGLARSFKRQAYLFHELLGAVETLQQGTSLSTDELQRVIAQAAQESALLAVPYLNQITYIHFHGLQQLSYVYVPLKDLRRSEFSKPEHVLEVIEEILLSFPDGGLCPIAPIAIATYPDLVNQREPAELTIIVDGNHRVTAVMLLRVLALRHQASRREADAKAALQQYCKEHGLGAKWHIDLQDVLKELFSVSGKSCLKLIYSMQSLVGQFAKVTSIPALVVQEESFHTVCMQRTLSAAHAPKLLQPMHQALYNDESLGFAFPNTGQVHGRTAGFRALPLIPIAGTHYSLNT